MLRFHEILVSPKNIYLVLLPDAPNTAADAAAEAAPKSRLDPALAPEDPPPGGSLPAWPPPPALELS